MKSIVIANWKMNLALSDALVLSGQISKYAESFKNIDVVLAPSSIYMYPIKEHLKNKPTNFHLAGQDIFYEQHGAFTGEISTKMIRPFCSYSIVGHSERRKYFGETDEIINRKIKSLILNKMKAIVCVGEKERYHLEDHFDYEVKRMSSPGGILESVEKVLAGLKSEDLDNVIIAYEPIWAIGTGNCASGAYASSVCYIIKSFLTKKYSQNADKIKIVYGGSVDGKAAEEYIVQPNIDGFLVGTASLSAKEFKEICRVTSEKSV